MLFKRMSGHGGRTDTFYKRALMIFVCVISAVGIQKPYKILYLLNQFENIVDSNRQSIVELLCEVFGIN